MLTSLPAPPRPRPRLTDPQDHPYRPSPGAEVVAANGWSLPLVSAMLRGTAQGGLARLVLEQRFENHHDETLHVTYRMPLPADGAVSGYAFVIADRTIVGRVERKQEARERFERAIASGHTAALLEQDRADTFTQSIGNLPPGEALIARITVDLKLAWLAEGEWELRFPTVLGPRYVGASDSPATVHASRIETAPGGVPARIQIAITIRDELTAGRGPSSPSHALTAGAGGTIELRDLAGARLDRNLVVRWPVAGAATGISLAVTRAERGDDCYGLVTIVPPAAAALDRVLPRDLIVLIDTSGSMFGPPLAKAKQVIALLIDSLGDADRLELIAFSSEPRRYQPAPVAATRGEKHAAIRWLRKLSAGGGTEMRTAVIEALHTLRPGAQRQVVLATDGYIGGEAELVQQLHAGLPASCRLHFVGVGSSVNRSLAVAMARAGRGTEVICDLDEDAERAVKRLLDRTRSPVVTDVTIDGNAVMSRAPEAVPDVHAASPVVVAVKLRAGELVVRGRTHAGEWERRLRVGMPRPGEGDPAIAALFGREHVADLEARRFAGEDHDAAIERTGLAFQIATRLTPFVAVDERSRQRFGVRHEEVPQELPYGMTAAAFGLRSTAGAAAEPWFKGVETLLEADAEAPQPEHRIVRVMKPAFDAVDADDAEEFGEAAPYAEYLHAPGFVEAMPRQDRVLLGGAAQVDSPFLSVPDHFRAGDGPSQGESRPAPTDARAQPFHAGAYDVVPPQSSLVSGRVMTTQAAGPSPGPVRPTASAPPSRSGPSQPVNQPTTQPMSQSVSEPRWEAETVSYRRSPLADGHRRQRWAWLVVAFAILAILVAVLAWLVL